MATGSQASYPNGIKYFQTFVPFYDINYAEHVNDIRAEITALESTIGATPFAGLPAAYQNNLNYALTDLYENKAPVNHEHVHDTLYDLELDGDHSQYLRADGSNSLLAPISVVEGTSGSSLVSTGQVAALGYLTKSEVEAYVAEQMGGQVQGVFPNAAPGILYGSPPSGNFKWKLGGGYNEGLTDPYGNISTTVDPAFSTCVLTFVASKAPVGLGIIPENVPGNYENGEWLAPPYDRATSVMTLTGASLDQFTMTFTTRVTGAPVAGLHVAFSWFALGV